MHWYDEIKRVLEGKQMTVRDIANAIFGEPTTTQIINTSIHVNKLRKQGFCRKCGEAVINNKKCGVWELV